LTAHVTAAMNLGGISSREGGEEGDSELHHFCETVFLALLMISDRLLRLEADGSGARLNFAGYWNCEKETRQKSILQTMCASLNE
jgi:hypothetical protein